MKDGKPEVVGYLLPGNIIANGITNPDKHEAYALIRLSDHEAVVADLHKSIQRMIDQTTPLVPDPNDPKWSKRIQIDDLIAQVAELKSLLDEVCDASVVNMLSAEQCERIDAALSK